MSSLLNQNAEPSDYIDSGEDPARASDASLVLLFPSAKIVYRIDALGEDGLLAATANLVGDGFTALQRTLLQTSVPFLRFLGHVLW